MVIEKSHTFRPAVAMIELIFALVVMGIVLMSAPALISTASKSSYVTIQQENINEASTYLNIILTYPWDERNAAQLDAGYYEGLLTTTDGMNALNVSNQNPRRSGTPSDSTRNSITNPNDAATQPDLLGSENGEITIDDIDDFANRQLLNMAETVKGDGKSDYLERNDIQIAPNVSYMNDNTASNTIDQSTITFTPFITNVRSTNIKHISVTLTTNNAAQELSKNIILQAFSCNIGNYKLRERP